MSTGNSHAAKIQRQHISDMSAIERANAKKRQQAAKRKRREVSDSRKPEKIKVFDRQIYRLGFLVIASKLMSDTPGSLREQYEKLAKPAGLTLRTQHGIKYWTAPPRDWREYSGFQSHFGCPGNPEDCQDSHGLAGHLFDDQTAHDSASVRTYAETWIAELERQRSAESQRYTVKVTDHGNGVTQSTYPSW